MGCKIIATQVNSQGRHVYLIKCESGRFRTAKTSHRRR
jgi:hypothetical protein